MFYDIIWEVLLTLALAVLLGELFEQFGLPSVAGELLSGLILGPSILHLITNNDQIRAVSTISLFFIIFLIGFEMRTETVRRHIPKASLISITSFIIPLLITFPIAFLLFHFGIASDFVFALAVSVPSISIISVLVLQYKLLEMETGQVILASVVITDTIAFIMLAIVSQSVDNIILLTFYLAVFVLLFAAIDLVLNSRAESFQRFLRSSSRLLKKEDISFAILIVVGLLVAQFFQSIGLSYIVGAFFAGLILHEELIGKEAFERISGTFGRLNRGFFIPIFFGFAGIEADLASNYGLIPLLTVVIVISVGIALSLTYYATKRLNLKDGKAPRQIAVILGGRGAVGIVIATVALSDSLISGGEYSLVIVGTMLVSIFVPLLLRKSRKITISE